MELKMNASELKDFLEVEFSQIVDEFEILKVEQNRVILSLISYLIPSFFLMSFGIPSL